MAILNFEVSKELASQAYQLVEKARNSGKIRKGSNEVTKSLERGEAKIAIIAEDASPVDIVRHIPILCGEKQIPVISVPAKAELGASAGLPVGTAAVAIADAGEGRKLLQDITKSIETLRGGKAKPIEKKEDASEKKSTETKKEHKPAEKEEETNSEG